MAIANVASKIIIGKYPGSNYNDMYKQLSAWREKNDFFDILYTYYYHIKPGGQDELKNGVWQVIPLPGTMNNWYTNFMRALSEEQFMIQYETSNAYLYDTVGFMYYYFEAAKNATEIKEGNNQLQKDLYQLLGCDSLFESNLRSGPRGYLFHMGPGMESEAVAEAWQRYLVLADIIINHPTATYAERAEDFEAAFEIMVEMAPSELYTFLSSVNFLYDASRGNVLVLDCSTRVYSTLMSMLANYYHITLPEEVFACFRDLLLAMENYSLYGLNLEAMTEFKNIMVRLTTAYEGLSQENKDIFDRYLGEGYTKYLAIYRRSNGAPSPDLGQWEATMEELKDTVLRFDEVMSVILNSTTAVEDKNRAVPVMIATYEKAALLHKQLMNAGVEVERELVTRMYSFDMQSVNLDYYFCAVRELYISFMISSGITVNESQGYMLWTLYAAAELRPVMAQIADLMWAEFKGQVYAGEDLPAIMAAIRAVSPADMNTFFMLGINQVYYAARERYFFSVTEGANELIPSLLRAEFAYAVYMNDTKAETLEGFTTEFANAMELYEKLENKEAFDQYLGQMYQIYLQHYQELNK